MGYSIAHQEYTDCIPNKIKRAPSDSSYLGGEGGIRTLGEREPTTVFKTVTLNHSVTSPIVTGVFYQIDVT